MGRTCKWSKPQANVAVSCGDVEMNSSAKGISERICGESRRICLIVGASGRKGTMLRIGAGKVKHQTALGVRRHSRLQRGNAQGASRWERFRHLDAQRGSQN